MLHNLCAILRFFSRVYFGGLIEVICVQLVNKLVELLVVSVTASADILLELVALALTVVTATSFSVEFV